MPGKTRPYFGLWAQIIHADGLQPHPRSVKSEAQQNRYDLKGVAKGPTQPTLPLPAKRLGQQRSGGGSRELVGIVEVLEGF